MKKRYTKPKIFFESFELMEHIASQCMVGDGTTVNYRDGFSCKYTDSNITMFNADTCQIDPDEYAGAYDSAEDYIKALTGDEQYTCYNAFSNGQVFAS